MEYLGLNKLLLSIIIILGIGISSVGALLPPELFANYDGKAITLTWNLPLDPKNPIDYKWIINRDIDGSGYIEIASGATGNEITSYIDSDISKGSVFTYLMNIFLADGTESQGLVSIDITTPPPQEDPPAVELFASNEGKAIIIKWIFPLKQTSDNFAYKWLLNRDIDNNGFVQVANGFRDPNNKKIDEGQEINYYIDSDISKGSVFTYVMYFVSSDGTIQTESKAAAQVTKDTGLTTTYQGIGTLEQTTRKLIPFNPNIKPLSFIQSPLIPAAYAPSGGLSVLVTSSLNPNNEPYLFALSPTPSPEFGSNCWQALEIIYKRTNGSFGQDLNVYATILEDQIIVRNQHLFDDKEISNDGEQIYNYWFIIPPEDQLIQNFADLEVQLDIDSSFVLDPNDYRQLEIYGVNLYVPADSSSC